MIVLSIIKTLAFIASVIMVAMFVAPYVGIVTECKWFQGKRFRRASFVMLAFGLTLYAGTKPEVKHLFACAWETRWLSNVQNSVSDDDVVTLTWKFSEFVINDELHIDVRDKDSTDDEDWVTVFKGNAHGTSSFTDTYNGSWSGVIEDATNKVAYLWFDYTPPPIVHTNGVYHLDGVMRPMNAKNDGQFIMPSIEIKRVEEVEEEQ